MFYGVVKNLLTFVKSQTNFDILEIFDDLKGLSKDYLIEFSQKIREGREKQDDDFAGLVRYFSC